MRSQLWGKLLLVLLAFTFFPAAQVEAQGINLGPQLGYFKSQDAEKGRMMYGVAARVKLLPMIGVEGSINYRQEKYVDGAVTVRSWPVMVTGLIYPLPLIYGAAGFGWYNTTFDYDQDMFGFEIKDQTTQSVGWHFGAGVELPAGGMKLTGDIRYVFLNYDFKDLPTSEDINSNFYVITVGLLFGI
ncbi:MAG: outer membrane beta-barrel protein [Calditrichia bacterium]